MSTVSAHPRGSRDLLEEVVREVVAEPSVQEALVEGLCGFGLGSLRSISCLSEGAQKALLAKLGESPVLDNLEEGVLSTYVCSISAEAKDQLAYASRAAVGSGEVTAARSSSRSRDYSDSVKAVSEKWGPIPDACMPTTKMVEALRGSPWTYVDLSRYFIDESADGRRDGTILAEKEDGTPVIIKSPEKPSGAKNPVRQFGAHWTLAFQTLGWAMLIVQDDINGGNINKGDLTPAAIDAHEARILGLAIQFNWFSATAADRAIRRKIEASASLGIAGLGDFYFRGDLLSEVILSSLAASSFQPQLKQEKSRRSGDGSKSTDSQKGRRDSNRGEKRDRNDDSVSRSPGKLPKASGV